LLPGTSILTVGLLLTTLGKVAGSDNTRGERSWLTLLTEEVFTAPDANRVDGCGQKATKL